MKRSFRTQIFGRPDGRLYFYFYRDGIMGGGGGGGKVP